MCFSCISTSVSTLTDYAPAGAAAGCPGSAAFQSSFKGFAGASPGQLTLHLLYPSTAWPFVGAPYALPPGIVIPSSIIWPLGPPVQKPAHLLDTSIQARLPYQCTHRLRTFRFVIACYGTCRDVYLLAVLWPLLIWNIFMKQCGAFAASHCLADNVVIYHTISFNNDCQCVQSDLNIINSWCYKWLVSHIFKTKGMTLTVASLEL